MEGTESTTRARATGKDGNQEVDQTVLMSSKPLHRFVQKEPRSLGIVLVIFGCAELLMGFSLASENVLTSLEIYGPFWQGVLFLVCGSLSIYTGLHPSKKMVTVSLAMYVVTFFGIVVSVGFRIHCLSYYSYRRYSRYYWMSGHDEWSEYRWEQLFCLETLLLTSSLCVSVLLIFLCTIARLALRSTRTQIIVQHIPPPPPSTTTSN